MTTTPQPAPKEAHRRVIVLETEKLESRLATFYKHMRKVEFHCIPLDSNVTTTPQPAPKEAHLRVSVLEGLELESHLNH